MLRASSLPAILSLGLALAACGARTQIDGRMTRGKGIGAPEPTTTGAEPGGVGAGAGGGGGGEAGDRVTGGGGGAGGGTTGGGGPSSGANKPPSFTLASLPSGATGDGSESKPLTFTLAEGGTPLEIALIVADPDGDVLALVCPGAPAWVTVDGQGRRLILAPSYDDAGTGIAFSCALADAKGATATLSFVITVTPVNQPPSLALGSHSGVTGVAGSGASGDAITFTIPEGGNGEIVLAAVDPDGDPVALSCNGTPVWIAITSGTTKLAFAPGYTHATATAAAFTCKVFDGAADSAVLHFAATVTDVNRAPLAVDDAAATPKGVAVTIDVRANDSDPDGNQLTVTAVTDGASGAVAINGGTTVTYTPASAAFAGTDTFTYTVSDGAGGSTTADVTVWVADDGTWLGTTGDGLWSNAGNWAGGKPTTTRSAKFTGACLTTCNVLVDEAVNALGFAIAASFDGVITQGAGQTIIARSQGWSQAGGRFAGGADAITIRAPMSLLGGSFRSTSGVLRLEGDLGGQPSTASMLTVAEDDAFEHNGGTLTIGHTNVCQQSRTIDPESTLVLHDVRIDTSYNGGCGHIYDLDVIVPNGKSIRVQGTLRHMTAILGSGDWRLEGGLEVGAGAYGGQAVLSFVGDAAQTYSYTAGGLTANVVVDKGANGVAPAIGTSELKIGYLQLLRGSFTAPSTTLRLARSLAGVPMVNTLLSIAPSATLVDGGGTLSLEPTVSCQHRLTVDVDASLTVTSLRFAPEENPGCGSAQNGIFVLGAGDQVTVTGDLEHDGGYISHPSGTSISVRGNIRVGAKAVGGHGLVILDGSGDQTYEQASASVRTAYLRVDKATGSVLPAAGTNHLGVEQLEVARGAFVAPSGELHLRKYLTSYTSGGLLPSMTPLLTVAPNSGSFAHGGGTVHFDPFSACGQAVAIDVTGNLDLADVVINPEPHSSCGPGFNAVVTVVAGGSVTVSGTLQDLAGSRAGTWIN